MPNPAGAHSLGEILSQPEFWGRCLAALEKEGSLAASPQALSLGTGMAVHRVRVELLHRSGCGSLVERHHQTRARAIPASELLLFPELVLAGAKDVAAVVISRSGQTSEAVRAAQLLEREKNIRVLAVTGTPASTAGTNRHGDPAASSLR